MTTAAFENMTNVYDENATTTEPIIMTTTEEPMFTTAEPEPPADKYFCHVRRNNCTSCLQKVAEPQGNQMFIYFK